MNDAIERVREINITDAVQMYGVSVKHGKANCPFHHDVRTPNLSFKNNKFKCFACGEGGDLIDFVGKYFGLNFTDAIKKINVDFSLNLDLDKPMDAEMKSEYITRKVEKARIHDWYVKMYKRMCDAFKICRRYEIEFDFDDDDCCESIRRMALLEWFLDMEEEKLYEYREEVSELVRKIK